MGNDKRSGIPTKSVWFADDVPLWIMIGRLFSRIEANFAIKIMNFKSRRGRLHGEPRQDAQIFVQSACHG